MCRHVASKAGLAFVAIASLMGGMCWGQPSGHVLGWGSMVVREPHELQDLVLPAAGIGHSLALKSDG